MGTLDNPITPSSGDVALAQESSRILAQASDQKITLSVAVGQLTKNIKLPDSAVEMLIKTLSELANGNAITLVPTRVLLTTQQAADLLGVSRPFVIQQMKNSIIPFQKVGTHRRIAITELVKYQQKMAQESDEAMNELVKQAQELGMGY